MDGRADGKVDYIKKDAEYFQNKIESAGRPRGRASDPSREAKTRASDSIINNKSKQFFCEI
jgi:hypothetical protein